MDAPEANNGPVRSVIVFRLRPVMRKDPQGDAGEVMSRARGSDGGAIPDRCARARTMLFYARSKIRLGWNKILFWPFFDVLSGELFQTLL
jgi:hypothetical protein